MRKIFSVGFTFGMDYKDFIKIIDEFKDYIYEIYFPSPLNFKFYTRKSEEFFAKKTPDAFKKLIFVLKYAKKKGINLNFLLNNSNIKLEEAKKELKDFFKIIPFNSLTTFPEIAQYARKEYPFLKLICSYNVGVKTYDKLESISNYFDVVVLGNSKLRDFDFFLSAKKLGLKVKLLLNNGCSFNCDKFCSDSKNCFNHVKSNLLIRSPSQLYAEQSIMPWEFNKFYLNSKVIDYFKISSRPSSYDELRNCLLSYINNINRDLIDISVENYHLWARLSFLHYYRKKFVYSDIILEKEKIWSNIKYFL